MATRILIVDTTGRPRCGLDGHHGEAHAAAWVQAQVARFAARGEDVIAVHWHPEAGGDAALSDCLAQLHRLQLELHERPDGRRELVGLTLHPERRGEGTPRAVRGSLKLLAAPASIAGSRHPLRIPISRLNPAAGAPRTAAEARAARRQARAQERA